MWVGLQLEPPFLLSVLFAPLGSRGISTHLGCALLVQDDQQWAGDDGNQGMKMGRDGGVELSRDTLQQLSQA